ncbi:MAG: hypothetical protein M3010_09060 [Candidatus Dormibacteraeota bacterium]|nr:hypothetical protein [Candidatus Dormibacteraeota bacterium]
MSRRPTRVLGVALPLLAEGAFLQRYAAQGAAWHWYIHLFTGATLALLLMAFWTRRHHRPVPYPLVWVVLAHIYAAVPDILIPESIPHQHWQDVFVAHVASHYAPGRGATLLVVASLALGGYLLTLDRTRDQS